MPNQLEAFRIGEQYRIDNRQVLSALIISLVGGIPLTSDIPQSVILEWEGRALPNGFSCG